MSRDYLISLRYSGIDELRAALKALADDGEGHFARLQAAAEMVDLANGVRRGAEAAAGGFRAAADAAAATGTALATLSEGAAATGTALATIGGAAPAAADGLAEVSAAAEGAGQSLVVMDEEGERVAQRFVVLQETIERTGAVVRRVAEWSWSVRTVQDAAASLESGFQQVGAAAEESIIAIDRVVEHYLLRRAAVAAGFGAFFPPLYVIVGVTAALSAFSAVSGGALDAADRLSAVQATLAAKLEETEYAAGLTTRQIEALARAEEAAGGRAQAAITAGLTALLQYKDVAGETFLAAGALLDDLVAKTGKDFPAAAQLLGRALTDTTGGVQALADAQIRLTREQRAGIAAAAESGDKEEYRRQMLAALTAQLGDAAKSMSESDAASARLDNAITHLLEAIGGRIQVLRDFRDQVLALFDVPVTWFKNRAADVVDYVAGVISGGPVQQQLETARAELAAAEQQARDLAASGGGDPLGQDLANVELRVESARRKVAGLEAQMDRIRQEEEKARQGRAQREAEDRDAGLAGLRGDVDRGLGQVIPTGKGERIAAVNKEMDALIDKIEQLRAPDGSNAAAIDKEIVRVNLLREARVKAIEEEEKETGAKDKAAASTDRQIVALQLKIDALKDGAAAARESVAAEQEVERQAQVAAFAAEKRAAAAKVEGEGRAAAMALAEQEIVQYDALTTQALELQRAKEAARDLRGQEQQLAYGEEELRLLGLAGEEREKELARLKARNELLAKGRDLNSEDAKTYIANAEKLADQAAVKRSFEEWRSKAREVSGDVKQFLLDGFVDATKGGKSAFDGMWDALRAGGKRMLAKLALDFAEQKFIMPVVMTGMNALSSVFGMSGGPAPSGTSYTITQGAGGQPVLTPAGGVGMPSVGGGGSIWTSLNGTWLDRQLGGGLTDFGNFMSTPLYGGPSTAMMSGIDDVGQLGYAPGTTPGGGVTPGNMLSGVGYGLNSFMNFQNGNVIGGIGNAAATIMSFIPGLQPFAPFVAIASQLLGGLFGPEPSTEYGGAWVNRTPDGAVVGKASGADQTATQHIPALEQAAEKASAGTLAALKASGLVVEGGLWMGVERDTDGTRVKRDGWSGPVVSTSTEVAQVVTDTMRDLARAGRLTGDENVVKALTAVQDTSAENVLKAVEYARNFDDAIAAMSNSLGLEDAARKGAKASVEQVTKALQEFRDNAAAYGQDTEKATAATAAYLKALITGADQKVYSAAEAAIIGVQAQFEELTHAAETMGVAVTPAEIAAGKAKALETSLVGLARGGQLTLEQLEQVRQKFPEAAAAIQQAWTIVAQSVTASYRSVLSGIYQALDPAYHANAPDILAALGIDSAGRPNLTAKIQNALAALSDDYLNNIRVVETLQNQIWGEHKNVTREQLQAIIAAVTQEAQAKQQLHQQSMQQIQAQREALLGAGRSLSEWLDRLRGTDLGTNTTAEQLVDARAAFERQLGLARGGDVEAYQSLSGYAETLIAAVRKEEGAGADSDAVIDWVEAQIAGLPAVQSYQQQSLALLGTIATASGSIASNTNATAGNTAGAAASTASAAAATAVNTAKLDAFMSESGIPYLRQVRDAIVTGGYEQAVTDMGGGVIGTSYVFDARSVHSQLSKYLDNIAWETLMTAVRMSQLLASMGIAPEANAPPGHRFADGGIMTAWGPAALRTYSGGGIASSPQVAVWGEGSVPEAFVPVPSGRIPVEMRVRAAGAAPPAGGESVGLLRRLVAGVERLVDLARDGAGDLAGAAVDLLDTSRTLERVVRPRVRVGAA